jgi:uncharacterized membrane protein required for colicin V production
VNPVTWPDILIVAILLIAAVKGFKRGFVSELAGAVVGMFLTGLITYGIVVAASWVLNRFAKLPLINIGNAAGGAIIGFFKGAVLLWLVLFVALYFPLSPDIRKDLHHSHLAGSLVEPNANIDRAILSTIPMFARPFLNPYFHRHHV